MAETLLSGVRDSNRPDGQQYLCLLTKDVFTRAPTNDMETLRSSTSADDRALLDRVFEIHAEKDSLLDLQVRDGLIVLGV